MSPLVSRSGRALTWGGDGMWKEKEKPIFPKAQPCCCSNQAPSRLFDSNVAPCPSSSLSLFIFLGWKALRPNLPGFQQSWSFLLPCVTRAHWQHRVRAPQVVAVSIEDELSLEQVVAPEVELLHETLGWLDWGKVWSSAMKDIALAIDSECCCGSARGWVGAHGWQAVGMRLPSMKRHGLRTSQFPAKAGQGNSRICFLFFIVFLNKSTILAAGEEDWEIPVALMKVL